MKRILEILFTILYFLIFLFLIDLIFRNTLSTVANLLAIVCWIIAFIISIVLSEYTVKIIEENLKR